MSGETYDLVIIGAGSGNTIVNRHFDSWKVAIVERDLFGGTCLNRGCIPTKMLVHPADVVRTVEDASRLGVDAHVDGVRWRDVRDRVFGRIDPIAADGLRFRRSQPHVEVLTGDAAFVGPRHLRVTTAEGDRELRARHVVVAAGARPSVPDIEGLEAAGYETSDTAMRVERVPERLVVIGGGFIAAELSHVFGAFGSSLCIVSRGETLLSHHDRDIATAYTAAAAARAELRLGVQAKRARRVGGEVVLDLDDGTEVRGDMLLVAAGRTPNSDRLGLDAAGIATHADGRIRTDEFLRTSAEGVFALGDIRAPDMLKHVANHEARVVRHNLQFPDEPQAIREGAIPHAVFGNPQVAAVGITEAEARRRHGDDVVTAVRRYSDTAAGWAMEDTTSFCKVVASASTREILGAHIIGPQASILIQCFVQAIVFGQTADELAKVPMYPHPALSEVVEQALLELAPPP